MSPVILERLDPKARTLRGRIGAHTAHSRNAGLAITAKARKTFLDQFETQVDPAGELTPEERSRRAQHALSAHMARLALERHQAARKRKASPEASLNP